MFFPYHADVAMFRWPVTNWVIIGLTIVVSVALFGPLGKWEKGLEPRVSFEGGKLRVEAAAGVDQTSVVNYFMLEPGHFRVSQLVGSLLIHEGYIHLLGNMWFLWVFGNAVNGKLGNFWYVVFYLAAGVFEGGVYMLCGPRAPCMGASGAIMGVVGAFLVLYPRNDVRTMVLVFVRPYFFEVAAIWIIAFYVAFDVWGLVSSGSGRVAYISHVAGFCFGMVVMGGLVWWEKVLSHEMEENLLQMVGWQAREERDLLGKNVHRPVAGVKEAGGGERVVRRVVKKSDDLPPIEMS